MSCLTEVGGPDNPLIIRTLRDLPSPEYQKYFKFGRSAKSVRLPGSGTSKDPYRIGRLSDLYAMSNSSAHFILIRDIVANSSRFWNNFEGWLPIESFSGVLDGKGFSIKGICTNRPDIDNQGLFSTLEKAEISNLNVAGDITGNKNVGILVGKAYFTKISNCCVKNSFANGLSYTGSFIGCNCSSILKNIKTINTLINSVSMSGRGSVGRSSM